MFRCPICNRKLTNNWENAHKHGTMSFWRYDLGYFIRFPNKGLRIHKPSFSTNDMTINLFIIVDEVFMWHDFLTNEIEEEFIKTKRFTELEQKLNTLINFQ